MLSETCPPFALNDFELDSAFCFEATTVKSARPTWPVTFRPNRPVLFEL
jgi:hypothetical protein